jgi:hypothetical protein
LKIDTDISSIQPNLWQVILDELNIKNVSINDVHIYPAVPIEISEDELAQEGLLRDFVREIQALRKEAKVGLSEVIDIEVPALQLHLAEKAKVQGRIGKIAMGDVLRVV